MKVNNTGSIVLFISVGLIIAGALLAINSRSDASELKEENDKPLFENKSQGKFYPGLETVFIPEIQAAQMKEYTGFTVSFNKDNHTPNYVAWELLGSEVASDVKRSNKFWQDQDIEGCPVTSDYTHSGFDRGHMCPAADQKWSEKAMDDCFVMANICPQDHSLNAGAWNTLENKERLWAQRDSALMIIAGPIYTDNDNQRIGNIGVRVPGAFFKALLAPYVENPRAIAFVYPNMTSPGNMKNYAMSIDDLEQLTGYDFFPALPDDIENKVESEFSFTEWNRMK